VLCSSWQKSNKHNWGCETIEESSYLQNDNVKFNRSIYGRGYTYKERVTGARASDHQNTTRTYSQKQHRNMVSCIVRFTRTRLHIHKLILDDTCMFIMLYRKGTIAKYLAGPTKLERGKEHISPQHLQKITAVASTNQNFANNFQVFYTRTFCHLKFQVETNMVFLSNCKKFSNLCNNK
jgi:hypothetical protein